MRCVLLTLLDITRLLRERFFFRAVPGILEKIFSSFHHKKAQANNIDRTGVTAWMIFFFFGWGGRCSEPFHFKSVREVFHSGFLGTNNFCAVSRSNMWFILVVITRIPSATVLIFSAAVCVSVSEGEAKT